MFSFHFSRSATFVVAARCFSSNTSKKIIFSRQLKRRHRNFAVNQQSSDDCSYYNYLREESNQRLVDRVDDINKTFPVGLEIGCYNGHLYDMINGFPSLRSEKGGIGGIERLIQCDLSSLFPVEKDKRADSVEQKGNLDSQAERKLDSKAKGKSDSQVEESSSPIVKRQYVQIDEEFLPFPPNTFDIVLSSLYLHWSNDLFSTLSGIHDVLKPDGVFIASMFGGNTLKELRQCFFLAEQERKGGISFLHTSPFPETLDIAAIVQNTGFTLPTVDVDTITVTDFLLCSFCLFLTFFIFLDFLPKRFCINGASFQDG
jgi:NADH dehydrogenase [ubiquinone] 1 alpha subcomplex assembly factor 5